MKPLKTILLALLILVVLGTGAVAATNRGLLTIPTWVSKIPRSLPTLPKPVLPPEAQAQVSILSDRTKTLTNHAGQVLGSYIQATENKEPLHQRTFEYARFLYCQQVVKDYEAELASASSRPASPTP